MSSVAVVILTFNEELHLRRALNSVASFASSVHVIDSFSTDGTLDIAEQYGAEVLQNKFKNQADQFEWALSHISTDAAWILRLDADEVIEEDLAAKLNAELDGLPSDVNGITFDRKHIFMGRWIRRGGRYPLRLVRAFRRGHGKTEQRWMDEHIFITDGRTVHFEGGFADHNLNDLSYFVAKHNAYATREAIEVLNFEMHFLPPSAVQGGSTSHQATVKHWVKTRIYNRIPFPISTIGYFLFRYTIQLGILDGREGTIYHGLQGLWYRFLVGAKTEELRRAVSKLKTKEAIRAELARQTRLEL